MFKKRAADLYLEMKDGRRLRAGKNSSQFDGGVYSSSPARRQQQRFPHPENGKSWRRLKKENSLTKKYNEAGWARKRKRVNNYPSGVYETGKEKRGEYSGSSQGIREKKRKLSA